MRMREIPILFIWEVKGSETEIRIPHKEVKSKTGEIGTETRVTCSITQRNKSLTAYYACTKQGLVRGEESDGSRKTFWKRCNLTSVFNDQQKLTQYQRGEQHTGPINTCQFCGIAVLTMLHNRFVCFLFFFFYLFLFLPGHDTFKYQKKCNLYWGTLLSWYTEINGGREMWARKEKKGEGIKPYAYKTLSQKNNKKELIWDSI